MLAFDRSTQECPLNLTGCWVNKLDLTTKDQDKEFIFQKGDDTDCENLKIHKHLEISDVSFMRDYYSSHAYSKLTNAPCSDQKQLTKN